MLLDFKQAMAAFFFRTGKGIGPIFYAVYSVGGAIILKNKNEVSEHNFYL